MSDPTCWLAQFTDTPCDGVLVRAHLLQKQWLAKTFPEGAVWLPEQLRAVSALDLRRKGIAWDDTARELSLEQLRKHPALWEPGCGGPMGQGGHHGQFDGYRLLVPRSRVSQRTVTFIHELGLGARWERDRRYAED